MSEPRVGPTLEDVSRELISAESALNQPFCPDPDAREDHYFMPDRDLHVRHAMEHLHAAYSSLLEYMRNEKQKIRAETQTLRRIRDLLV